MSASEKLKGLEAATQGWTFSAKGDPMKRYFDALPQIVAVVEAAEEYRESRGSFEALSVSLRLLDEALCRE